MTSPSARYDLAVIGAGPGGYTAAFAAADSGLKVVLIDREDQPGGVCLYRGCIPSKALLHVASVLAETRRMAAAGLTYTEPGVDLNTMRSWKNNIVATLTGNLSKTAGKKGVTYIKGSAVFKDKRTVHITHPDDSSSEVSFENALIATGSVASTLPGFPDDRNVIWTSREALDLPRIPGSLLVIGGGYIGLELGTVYAALGSKVHVVEALDDILNNVDRDLTSQLKRHLKTAFSSISTATTVQKATIGNQGVNVVLVGKNGEPREASYEAVLMAVGRKPNTAHLKLENTRVERNDRGYIQVDKGRRTAESNIYAIGDAAGEPMLAHKAMHEAKIAVENITGGFAVFQPLAVPAVVYTMPEIAWCGITETEARNSGKNIRVGKVPWRSSGRALTLENPTGMTKIIADEETGRILGVGCAGPHAGELIAEGVLAVEMAAVVDDLKLTIHPHPTLSEMIAEAAEQIQLT